MKKYLALLLAFSLVTCGSLFAQEKPAAEPAATLTPAEEQERLMALAKASQNPLTDMVSIPVQFNFYTGGGLGDQTVRETLLQPVLPLSISPKWNLIARTIVPYLNIPESKQSNGNRLKGIGDIEEELVFSPKHSGKITWGVGPVLSFPTATINEIATGQFAIGPTAAIILMPGKWLFGAVANNIWRMGGSDSTTAINQFFVQPFINYNLKGGWAISTGPAISANWAAPVGQQWTVPIGIGFSKVTLVGAQHVSVILQYYHNIVRPDNGAADQVRMQVSLLLPSRARAIPPK